LQNVLRGDADVSRQMTRVFLLDDHEVVRRGVQELLSAEDDLEVVGEASTAAEAITRIPVVRPDVAVLDVRLPDGDGIEVCREIRSTSPEVACLMLTSFADDEAFLGAVLAGASGYVLKQIRGSDLVGSIRRVARGESLLDPLLVARTRERLGRDEEDKRLGRLSPQERKILDLIAQGKTNRDIAGDLYLAEKTVKNYVSNVLLKLGMQRRTEAAVFAVRAEQHERPTFSGPE
jgi:two-component system response regulator DevR